MSLNDLLDDLSDRARPRVRLGRVPLDPGVVLGEPSFDRVVEDSEAVRRLGDVVLDVLDEPPGSVSAVVPGRPARVEEVRDKTMLENGAKGVNVLSRGRELAGGEEETSEGDKDLTDKGR
jgi:hypothetical protein